MTATAAPIELDYRAATPLAPALRLDLYRPTDGPVRATVLYAHGGGFRHGSRKDGFATELAERLLSQGIALASIDYRLGTRLEAFSAAEAARIRKSQARSAKVGLRLNAKLCGPAFYAAVEDYGAALSFLREQAAHLALAPPFIAIGASAGGIAAISLAYPPIGPWQDLPRPDGAMGICAAMVQPWRLTPSGPPAVLMHGFRDRIIPPPDLRLVAHRARKVQAPLNVVITAVRGHNPQLAAFLNDSNAQGRPYFDLLQGLLSDQTPSPDR